MKTLREYIEILDEISRRDFLKGAGATAGLAAMGGAKADWVKGEKTVDPMDDVVYQKWNNTSTDGSAILEFNQNGFPGAPGRQFILKTTQPSWMPSSAQPNGRIRVDNQPPLDIWLRVSVSGKEAFLYGAEAKFSQNYLRDYILSAKQRVLIDASELWLSGKTIYTFNVKQIQREDEELDEVANPDAVKRIEQLVQYK